MLVLVVVLIFVGHSRFVWWYTDSILLFHADSIIGNVFVAALLSPERSAHSAQLFSLGAKEDILDTFAR